MQQGLRAGNEAISTFEKRSIPNINITNPGYLYVFVSNESEDTQVWFDGLTITHQMSNVVAGADYYPFGLVMDTRQINREDYRYGYQGQYSEKDKETGYNAFEMRMYDASIGRWISPDPYGQFNSPYVAVGNDPVMGTDPTGGLCETCLTLLMNDPTFQAIMNSNLLPEVTVKAAWYATTLTAVEKFGYDLYTGAVNLGSRIPKQLNNTGYFANAANHLLTQGIIGLDRPQNEIQQGQQNFGLAATTFFMTVMSDGMMTPGGSPELITPNGVTIQPPSVPVVSTTLDEHGTVFSNNGSTQANRNGQQRHKGCKVGDVVKNQKIKEFTIPGSGGLRVDFVDFITKTIFELKPNNPRAIRLGERQLQNYKSFMEKEYGSGWNTQLDTY